MTVANRPFVAVKDAASPEVSATLAESKHLITVNMDLNVSLDAAGKVHAQMWFDASKHARLTKIAQMRNVVLSATALDRWQFVLMEWKKILISAIQVVNVRVMHAWIVDVHLI